MIFTIQENRLTRKKDLETNVEQNKESAKEFIFHFVHQFFRNQALKFVLLSCEV